MKLLYVNACVRENSRTNILAENFYGIKDISYIKAEGLDILGADTEKILETAKNEIIKIII